MLVDMGLYVLMCFIFEVRDASKKHVPSFNGASMFVKASYKGNKTDLNAVNVVVADWAVTSVSTIPHSELVAIQPADGSRGRICYF